MVRGLALPHYCMGWSRLDIIRITKGGSEGVLNCGILTKVLYSDTSASRAPP